MAPGTYMWVQVVHFELPPDVDDRAAITALVRSPGYVWDAASSYSPAPSVEENAVHGTWTLDAVTPDLFVPVSPAGAEATLHRWATDQEWEDPDYVPPADAMERLARVASLLRRGNAYVLQNPPDERMHDYGWVTGGGGFHEFVVIDRDHATLHLLIASDD